MGKTNGTLLTTAAATSRQRLITAGRQELKTLSGISTYQRQISNQQQMSEFRRRLVERFSPELRVLANQFRWSDLSLAEQEQEIARQPAVSVGPGLDPEALAADPEAYGYIQALQALSGRHPDADQRIDQLLAAATSAQRAKKPMIIDSAQLEILGALVSADRHRQQLDAAIEEAERLLTAAGYELPDCQIILIPPALSALASNCDQTTVAEAKLRTGRFYPRERVILIADDRQVIDRQLVLHELIHARQNQGWEDWPAVSAADIELYEALAERLVSEIDPSYQPWPEQRQLIKKIERLFPERDELSSLSWQPPAALSVALAQRLFPDQRLAVARERLCAELGLTD